MNGQGFKFVNKLSGIEYKRLVVVPIGFNVSKRCLDKAEHGELRQLTIGLSGTPVLCILGKPYMWGALE